MKQPLLGIDVKTASTLHFWRRLTGWGLLLTPVLAKARWSRFRECCDEACNCRAAEARMKAEENMATTKNMVKQNAKENRLCSHESDLPTRKAVEVGLGIKALNLLQLE
jgi:hypothetical protein